MQVTQNRRERERIMRRNAILEAAQVEFAEKGFVRAKLEDIAIRAEFGKGTLYNYFSGGKQGMLFAIFDRLFDDMEALIEHSFTPDAIDKKSFREAFYDYTVSCFSFYLDQKEAFLILVKEAHRMCFGENEEHASYFRDQQERMVRALMRPVRHAIDAGHIQPLDPSAIAHMILGNIQGMQVHMILDVNELPKDKPAFSPTKAATFLTRMLLDGLTNSDHEGPHKMPPKLQESPTGSHE